MAPSGHGLDEERLLARAWRFERGDGALIAPQLRLLPGGRVGMHVHPNEAGWAVRDGRLVFTDPDRCVRTRFDDVFEGPGGLRFAGPFVADPVHRHVLRGVDKLERLAGPGDAVDPLDRGTGGRRPNLVVLRANAGSLHTGWVRDIEPADRSWDLCISWYDPACPLRVDATADWEAMQPADTKYPALWRLFSAGSPFWAYERVMFPDDDLQMSWRGINRAFAVAAAHDLLLAQPALGDDGFITHGITRRQGGGSVLRFTDFVEVMTPIFSRAALRACAGTFALSRSAFGLDHVWPKLLGAPANRIGVIDAVGVTHTRPMGASYSLAGAISEGHRLMQAFGVWESYRELGRIVA